MGKAALLLGVSLFVVGACSPPSLACAGRECVDSLGLLQLRNMGDDVVDELTMPETSEIQWFCFEYAFWQSDQWCAVTERLGALELRFSADGEGPCKGAHPGETCTCCARAASRDPVVDGPLPRPPGRHVEFVTVETRKEDVELWLVPGVTPKNVGYGKDFHKEGFMTKTKCYRDYLANIAESDPTRLVVLLDTDMGWGGCSEEEFLSTYHAIVHASGGAKIVTGGDPFQWPAQGLQKLRGQIEQLAGKRRAATLQKLGLDSRGWDAFVPTKHEIHNEYIFVNSGFVMGPAEDLLWLMGCSMKMGWKPEGGFDDQLGMAACAVHEPGRVTIDYTSLLVVATQNMRNNIIQIQGNRIINNLGGKTQCFVHADGVSPADATAQARPWQDTNHMKAWLAPATEMLKKLS